MMLGTGPSSPRSIKSSIEPSAGGETAPHPGNKDKSFEKKPEFGVGSVSSFYLAVSSCKISYDDRVWECLARTGNIRAENLSNVLLSGETEWTGMRRWGWVLWLGRVRETIEWDPELLSDVRRRAGPGESFVVSGHQPVSAQGGEEEEEVSDPWAECPSSSSQPFPQTSDIGDIAPHCRVSRWIQQQHWRGQTEATRRGHWNWVCWHRTILMLKLTKTWELYWSGQMNYAGSSMTELSVLRNKTLCLFAGGNWKGILTKNTRNQTFGSFYC